MQLVGCPCRITTLFLLLGGVGAGTITTAPKGVPTSISTQTCEFRTINYITDTLPQQCLKSAWSQANGTASVKTGGSPDATGVAGTASLSSDNAATNSGTSGVPNVTSTETVAEESVISGSSASSTSTEAMGSPSADLEEGELNDASFLSFEEWRKRTLEKAGQQNANIGGKRSGEHRKRDSESIQNNLDSLGEEGEIDIDFTAFQSTKNGEEPRKDSQAGHSNAKQERQEQQPKKKDQYRSKDAGKTCKERFSYASFDAGATVVKTHQGAKNSKAVLIENKDSYMLSECSTENKFLIIELSEDIWIDTLVLANYEFFSSMIRSFKVSVSDKYPVKIEKWKDAGTYEARNSREIQAFLIENPQIWARYIRIEFLTHYGNEYYCPLSLVRVHGTRMLESWKESEANNDDENESEDTEETTAEERFVPEAVADSVLEEEKLQAELKEAKAAIENLVKEAESITKSFAEQPVNSSQFGEINASLEDAVLQQTSTPWVPDFDFGAWMNSSQGLDVCRPRESPNTQKSSASADGVEMVNPIAGQFPDTTPVATPAVANNTILRTPLPSSASGPTSSAETTPTVISTPSDTTTARVTSNSTILNTTSTFASMSKSQNVTSSVKTKASSTSSSHASLPTQQESFFRAVSRRLQLLEANSTLSLKYIEEQSKILREAFMKVEKKQLQKSTSFLEALNSTVFTELRQIRQQYDEIWQSTIISLESQRDESKREILAITTRLNILADEVVFQKRMSIVQSVLLLLCLGLVIFSRVSISTPIDYRRKTRFPHFSIESPSETSLPGSPEYIMPENELPNERHSWVANGHKRQISDGSTISLGDEMIADGNDDEADIALEPFEEESPPTPISSYDRSDLSLSPPSRDDSSTPPVFSYQPLSSHPPTATVERAISARASPSNRAAEARFRSSSLSNPVWPPLAESPIRTPRKKVPFIRQQQPSPPLDDGAVQANGTNAPSVSRSMSHSQVPNYSQLPTIGVIPDSPVQGSGGGRSGRSSSVSFSIARKPLPALPRGDDE